MLIIFIIITGMQAIKHTDFIVGTAEESKHDDWESNMRTLTLVNSNIGPITGVLCAGYFLHVIGVPILRNAKEPKNNDRDLFLGYFFVFLSYLILGVLGYIGFIGVNFTPYFEAHWTALTAGGVDQNCMNMFSYKDGVAFVVRLSILLMILSGYPIIHYFTEKLLENLLCRN